MIATISGTTISLSGTSGHKWSARIIFGAFSLSKYRGVGDCETIEVKPVGNLPHYTGQVRFFDITDNCSEASVDVSIDNECYISVSPDYVELTGIGDTKIISVDAPDGWKSVCPENIECEDKTKEGKIIVKAKTDTAVVGNISITAGDCDPLSIDVENDSIVPDDDDKKTCDDFKITATLQGKTSCQIKSSLPDFSIQPSSWFTANETSTKRNVITIHPVDGSTGGTVTATKEINGKPCTATASVVIDNEGGDDDCELTLSTYHDSFNKNVRAIYISVTSSDPNWSISSNSNQVSLNSVNTGFTVSLNQSITHYDVETVVLTIKNNCTTKTCRIEIPDEVNPKECVLTVDYSGVLVFDAPGKTIDVPVTVSEGEFTVTPTDSADGYIHAEKGATGVTFSLNPLQQGESYSDAHGSFTIKGCSDSVVLSYHVTDDANCKLTVTPPSVSFDSIGQTLFVQVTSNAEWNISPRNVPVWLSAETVTNGVMFFLDTSMEQEITAGTFNFEISNRCGKSSTVSVIIDEGILPKCTIEQMSSYNELVFDDPGHNQSYDVTFLSSDDTYHYHLSENLENYVSISVSRSTVTVSVKDFTEIIVDTITGTLDVSNDCGASISVPIRITDGMNCFLTSTEEPLVFDNAEDGFEIPLASSDENWWFESESQYLTVIRSGDLIKVDLRFNEEGKIPFPEGQDTITGTIALYNNCTSDSISYEIRDTVNPECVLVLNNYDISHPIEIPQRGVTHHIRFTSSEDTHYELLRKNRPFECNYFLAGIEGSDLFHIMLKEDIEPDPPFDFSDAYGGFNVMEFNIRLYNDCGGEVMIPLMILDTVVDHECVLMASPQSFDFENNDDRWVIDVTSMYDGEDVEWEIESYDNQYIVCVPDNNTNRISVTLNEDVIDFPDTGGTIVLKNECGERLSLNYTISESAGKEVTISCEFNVKYNIDGDYITDGSYIIGKVNCKPTEAKLLYVTSKRTYRVGGNVRTVDVPYKLTTDKEQKNSVTGNVYITGCPETLRLEQQSPCENSISFRIRYQRIDYALKVVVDGVEYYPSDGIAGPFVCNDNEQFAFDVVASENYIAGEEIISINHADWQFVPSFEPGSYEPLITIDNITTRVIMNGCPDTEGQLVKVALVEMPLMTVALKFEKPEPQCSISINGPSDTLQFSEDVTSHTISILSSDQNITIEGYGQYIETATTDVAGVFELRLKIPESGRLSPQSGTIEFKNGCGGSCTINFAIAKIPSVDNISIEIRVDHTEIAANGDDNQRTYVVRYWAEINGVREIGPDLHLEEITDEDPQYNIQPQSEVTSSTHNERILTVIAEPNESQAYKRSISYQATLDYDGQTYSSNTITIWQYADEDGGIVVDESFDWLMIRLISEVQAGKDMNLIMYALGTGIEIDGKYLSEYPVGNGCYYPFPDVENQHYDARVNQFITYGGNTLDNRFQTGLVRFKDLRDLAPTNDGFFEVNIYGVWFTEMYTGYHKLQAFFELGGYPSYESNSWRFDSSTQVAYYNFGSFCMAQGNTYQYSMSPFTSDSKPMHIALLGRIRFYRDTSKAVFDKWTPDSNDGGMTHLTYEVNGSRKELVGPGSYAGAAYYEQPSSETTLNFKLSPFYYLVNPGTQFESRYDVTGYSITVIYEDSSNRFVSTSISGNNISIRCQSNTSGVERFATVHIYGMEQYGKLAFDIFIRQQA